MKKERLKKKFSKNTKFGGLWYKPIKKRDKKKDPLISIIMPNYKSKYLEKSIKSILNQNYKNIELIVVDGDSGKETVQILKKYNNKIDFWISEKDKGMWDAWNKGFKLAKGRFVGMINAALKDFLFGIVVLLGAFAAWVWPVAFRYRENLFLFVLRCIIL